MRDTGNRKTTLYPDVKRFDRSRNYIKGRQLDNEMINTGSPGNVTAFIANVIIESDPRFLSVSGLHHQILLTFESCRFSIWFRFPGFHFLSCFLFLSWLFDYLFNFCYFNVVISESSWVWFDVIETRSAKRKLIHAHLFELIIGDGLSSSLISAPSLLSSSLAKSAAVTIPKRFFDDSVVLSHGTAAMSHVRRPSGADDRFDDRKFNPHRYFDSSIGVRFLWIVLL